MIDFNYQCNTRGGDGCGLEWYGYPYCRCPACCNPNIIATYIEFSALDNDEQLRRLQNLTEEGFIKYDRG